MRVLALLAAVAFAQAPQVSHPIQIVTAGEHHGDEVPANAAGTWYALVSDGQGASLQRVRVTVARVKDEIVDEGDEMTGKRIDVSPAVGSIVLVRGIRGLRTARLPTVFVDKAVENVVDANFRGDAYQFWIECQEEPAVSGQRQERCDLKMRYGSTFQVLFTYGAYYEGGERLWASAGPTILWAGDLNRDGLLDVLLDTSDHENVNERRLYLSRPRGSGSLVEEVAVHTATGC
ncbi:MAG TPA: hypothetical protein VG106_15475 [Vicinamibacterales bacterium]|nr:hypothetical protein [Vicinamibacterales bacterium]